MSKFRFRLQKVLEYRETIEQRAKEAYLDARANRLEAEVVSAGIEGRRSEVLAKPADDLAARQAIETMMLKLDDDQRTQQSVITILHEEEAKAMAEWRWSGCERKLSRSGSLTRTAASRRSWTSGR